MNKINEGSSSKKIKKISLTLLRSMLKRGIVEFKYKKKDGTIRKAEGTLKKSLIPEIDKDCGNDFPKECFVYYDLEKDDWRMFLHNNFIGIINKKEKD